MSVLETFYILFKTDAKQAEKEAADLDKKIAELAAKGTNRNDKEKEQLKELRKKRGEARQDLKDQGLEVDKLGNGFTDMAEKAVSAFAKIIAVGSLAAKTFETAKFNSNLNIQGHILQQNTQDILTYGTAVEAAGGSVEAFQSYLQGATQQAANAGLKLPPIAEFMRNIRQQLDGLSGNEKLRRLNLLGITDPGMISLLEQSNEEFERSVQTANAFAKASEHDTEVAREFSKAWTNTTTSITSAFTDLGTIVLPIITKILNFLNTPVRIPDWLAAITPDFFLTKLPPASPASSARPAAGPPSANEKEAVTFWTAQGFSRAQVAALVANESRESGFDPNAVGDNGTARGINQWHGDRQRRILAGTGIDVTNASHADQLKASLWEMRQRGDEAVLRSTTSPEEAAAVLTRRYERPADADGEAIRRGFLARGYFNSLTTQDIGTAQNTLNTAGQTPFSSGAVTSTTTGGDKTVNLKVDSITIQTQATDANGISQGIVDGLQSHFRTTAGNYDDGIQY